MILIGRTLPPAPLWRMRSKQTLRVIEEAALAFTLAEAEELFTSYGLQAKFAAQAVSETWGRAAALNQLARAHREANATMETAARQGEAIRSSAEKRASQSRLQLVKGYVEQSSLRAG
jgi:ATP/maltotriose-dependent transcriptional regulator MalT